MKCRVLVGLLVLAGIATWISCGGSSTTNPQSNPGVIGTGYIFVATQGDQLLSPFQIDRATGKTTTNGAGVATGTRPSAAIMTPDGNAIFVANRDSGDISRYTITSGGTLTAVTPNTAIGTDSNPVAMAMDAAGKLLFVLDQGALGNSDASTISVFSIGTGGALTAVVQPGGNPTLDNATAIAVTPDGKYLYATNSVDSTISGYSVDGSGVLTALTGFPVTSGTTPMGMVVTPDDPANPSSNSIFLYVANANGSSGDISVYEVCDKPSLNCTNNHKDPGDLLEITGSPFSANGGEPGTMVIVHPAVITPPSGTFLYVSDHKLNRVLQYSVATVTGALTAMSPPAVSTGASPVWVSAQHDGQYVFSANNGSSSLSAYVIHDPTAGALTNVGTVIATGNNPSAVLVK